MTAKIKLNAASGGGSFSLQAPSSSANNRVMTLPDSADGTILTTTNPKVGSIIQVVSTTKSDTFTTSSSSFTDITGLSVAITPTSSSSKVLVTAVVQYSTAGSGGSRQAGRILRSHAGGTSARAVGDSNGNRIQSSFGSETSGGGGNMKSATITFLDSPARSDEVTYKVQAAAVDGNNFQLNTTVSDSNIASYPRVASHITVMEVAA